MFTDIIFPHICKTQNLIYSMFSIAYEFSRCEQIFSLMEHNTVFRPNWTLVLQILHKTKT